MPVLSSTTYGKLRRPSTIARILARMKLPVVTNVGFPACLPKIEYTPHATPAQLINPPAKNPGVVALGKNIMPNPMIALHTPVICQELSRSPRHKLKPIIVICTLPNNNNAPVAALSDI